MEAFAETAQVSAGRERNCPICGAPPRLLGEKASATSGRSYSIAQCERCWFSYVLDPDLDYESLYSEAYYRGRGADPLVDYLGEVERFDKTARRYEWHGIYRWACALTEISPETAWLDYGCGTGGLVTYLGALGLAHVEGFDQGWPLHRLEERAIPHVDEARLAASEACYDVVSMIEVIEHLPDPLATLRDIRRVLRPGGLLLVTTGNARPYRSDVTRWRYLVPDVHISLFEPSTLELALQKTGFSVQSPGFISGWDDIVHYKVLKNLRIKRQGPFEAALPWASLSRLANARWRFADMPVGRAPLREP